MCVPRQAPNGGGAAYPLVGGIPQDPLCPQKNRPTLTCRNFRAAGVVFRVAGVDLATTATGFCSAFVMPAIAGMPGSVTAAGSTALAGVDLDGLPSTGALPDPRRQAPFEVGDFITWQGTLSGTGPTAVIWVHTIDANVGIYTQPGTLPAYIAIGDNGIGVNPLPSTAAALPGVEATPRIFLEASTSDISSIVDIYLDDKGFSLPVGSINGPIVPDVIGGVANEYFRWITPESMTGTLANQATQPVGLVPASLVAQTNAFGGGIYTQFIGPQPGRARIRAIKVPAVDPTAAACPVSATTIGGGQGCAITSSPTRYIRAVLRSLCAPAATGAASSRAGFPVVPAANLDEGTAATSPNLGRFFDINGIRANLPGAGPGTSGVAHLIGPSACLESAQFANGLFTGQYMAPVGEYIFPENTLGGAPILPANFYHLGFLAYGENGKDGNSTRPQVPTPW